MSTRITTVLALLGLLLCAAAPAEAARRSDSKAKARTSKRAERREAKKAAPAKKVAAPKKTTRGSSRARTRKTADTSLRGRFASIPTPRVPAAAKLRLEFKPSGAGDGQRGKLFRPGKLKAKGPAGPSFAQKVRASTKRALRKQ